MLQPSQLNFGNFALDFEVQVWNIETNFWCFAVHLTAKSSSWRRPVIYTLALAAAVLLEGREGDCQVLRGAKKLTGTTQLPVHFCQGSWLPLPPMA
jgi:hypothetical protein